MLNSNRNGLIIGGVLAALGVIIMTGKTPTLSPRGILFLKKEEGFRSKPYKDIAGHWTIGYGTRITDSEAQKYAGGISEETAENWMMRHVEKDSRQLGLASLNLSQNVIDAVLICTYNIGAAAMKQSRAFGHVKSGNLNEAFFEWDWYHYRDPNTGELKISGGLMDRRAREAKMLTQGVYEYA